VDIEYASRQLDTASHSLSEATRQFGRPIGRKFLQRLAVLRAVDEFPQLYGHRSLRLHQLKGSRDGEFALTLTGNFRLIVQKVTDTTIRVLSVEDYHGN